jgi:phosphoribosylaminoimidazolecarboxamide formyltransferase/IMP cyclohydrolase
MPRALLSVSDKTDLTDLARALATLGIELVSTGGTARVLRDAGLPVTGVSDITGFPELLDGRVKTLHPRIHGGILARRSRADDLDAVAAHGIGLIDLVVVNLYPFERTAARPEATFAELVEEIDIGGPALVRAAAKSFRDVLVVVDPSMYAAVLDALRHPDGPSLAFRLELARRAFDHTARYDQAIAGALAGVHVSDGRCVRSTTAAALPATLAARGEKIRDLRYGENPHQRAAWYAGAGAGGLGRARVVQGKELSYTNLLDLDAAARIVLEFDEPAAVVIKHTNPCGVATGASAADAYVRARDADPLSAFGGIVGLNRPLDEDTARALVSTFIEAVVVPSVDEAARPILAKKVNMRVVVADLGGPPAGRSRNDEVDRANLAGATRDAEVRAILGAWLVQERDLVDEAAGPWNEEAASRGVLRVVTRRRPAPDEWRALRFAWRVCAHVKSNAVIFTGPDRTLAIGAGQMSRVDAVNVAVMKARVSLEGSVAASDAFFPFRDGLDAVAAAGATAVVQPGGSLRDEEVIAAADEHGLAMVFTGRRHFRH